MKLKYAATIAAIATGFAIAARSLAICTGWCELPATFIGAPGSLVTFAAKQGVAVPAPQVSAWVVTFLVWTIVLVILGHGTKKAVEKAKGHR